MSHTPPSSQPHAVRDEYLIDGIRVERYALPTHKTLSPLILVHGGGQASWCWEDFAPVLAQQGFDVHALNWRGRNGSAALDPSQLLVASIADVVADIAAVAGQFNELPILIGHSMGALACQLYAQDFDAKALLLLTPVVPRQVNAPTIDIYFNDLEPWGPLELSHSKELFFQGLSDEQCAYFYPKLVPESPVRVLEATRWTLAVNIDRITIPILVISGALDTLTPASSGQRLAELYGAEYRLEMDLGHNVLLGRRGKEVALSVIPWLLSHAGV